MKLFLSLITLCCIFLVNINARAQKKATNPLKLAKIFSSHMVLQRDKEISVWGWAQSGAKISVTINKKSVTTTAEDGQWLVKLAAMSAGGPYEMKIVQAEQQIILSDILIGEVWVCSGQSNMEWPLAGRYSSRIIGAEKAISSANFPQLRLFQLQRKRADSPQVDCKGKWQTCTPKTAAKFSATAFFFGRKLVKELKDVPVGLILTAWGGTPVRAWTDAKTLKQFKGFESLTNKTSKPKKTNSSSPTVLYNGMIHPLLPLAIRGAIWYQGESDRNRHTLYRDIFPAMVKSWRQRFQQGDFPFYYVQIAPFRYKEEKAGVRIREVQRECLALIPNSGMVCIMDKATIENIHPPHKEEVGDRLAYLALAKNYGFKIPYSGPSYKSHKVEGKRIRVSFDYAKDGLDSKGHVLKNFEIAAEDGQFYPATAVIDGSSIVVKSDKVQAPKNIRYGWGNIALAEFWNKAGLPASSFRTDQWQQPSMRLKK